MDHHRIKKDPKKIENIIKIIDRVNNRKQFYIHKACKKISNIKFFSKYKAPINLEILIVSMENITVIPKT